MNRFAGLIVVVVVLALALGVNIRPGPAVAQGTAQVSMWHWETPPHRVRKAQEVMERATKELGFPVEQVPVNFPEYTPKLLAAIAANQLPELVQVNPPQLMTLLSHDAVIPIDDLFRRLNGIARFPAPIAAQYRIDRKQFGLPVFGIVWPLQYRTDLYRQAGQAAGPRNWQDLLAAAKALTKDTDGDGRPDLYGFSLPVSTNGNYGSQVVWGFLRANGGAILDCTGGTEKVVFFSPKTVETYQFLAELAKYTPPGAENMDWAMGELMIKSGRAATAVFTGGFLSELDKRDPQLAGNIRTALIPPPDGGQIHHTGYPRAIVLTKAATRPGRMEAVGKFLEWLYQPKNHADYLMMEPLLYVPVTRAVAEDPGFRQHALISKYWATMETQTKAMESISVIGFENGCRSMKAGAIEGSFLLGSVLQRIITQKWAVNQAVAWGHSEYERIVRGR